MNANANNASNYSNQKFAVSKKTTTTPHCGACFKAGKPIEEYTSHWTRSSPNTTSPIVCPFILSSECGYCHQLGHWTKFCPSIAAAANNNANRDGAAAAARAIIAPSLPQIRVSNMFASLCEDDTDDDDDDTQTAALSEIDDDDDDVSPSMGVLSVQRCTRVDLSLLFGGNHRAEFPPLKPTTTAAVAVSKPINKMFPVDWSIIKKKLSEPKAEVVAAAAEVKVNVVPLTYKETMAAIAAGTMPPIRTGFVKGTSWADYESDDDDDNNVGGSGFLPAGKFAYA